MRKFFALFFIAIIPFFASELKEVTCNPQSDRVILPCLKGLLLLDNWDKVRKSSTYAWDCALADGVQLIQRNPDFLRALQQDYIGKPLTESRVNSLKNDIADFYGSNNQPFVIVTIPKQGLEHDVLQVVIEEARLGKVTVQGNCYFPSRWFAEVMRTNPGDTIDAKTVFEDIAWLNLNPFRRTDAIYKPGDHPGVADIELIAIDRWPYRLYMGSENSGTVQTDRNRIFFGVNVGKSVLKDGQISYQFTCAPNWNLYYSHTASARLPLPWRHVWVLWGGYASVEPSTHVANMKNRGVSWQVDTRYRFPSFVSSNFMQTFVVGYDFKETNNNVLFNGRKIVNTHADINQFMLGYEFGYRNAQTRVALTAELYFNPGGITHANQSQFYEVLRFDAKNKYVYFKLNHSAASKFSLGSLSYDLNAQVSTTNLLPSEQVTLTGYNAVRGFEERILNLDNALVVNLTYETPHWSLLKRFCRCNRFDEFYFLAFFDYGLGGNHHSASGETSFKNLASAGPGVRWEWDRYLTVRFDYGVQLWHSGFHNPTDSRYNFGLILSY